MVLLTPGRALRQPEFEVQYIVGLAKNSRLTAEIATELETAKTQFEATGHAARVFQDFTCQTLDSWSCARRVIGKAEHLRKGPNPRFVVTSLTPEEADARTLSEDRYCARGEMENRIVAATAAPPRTKSNSSCSRIG